MKTFGNSIKEIKKTDSIYMEGPDVSAEDYTMLVAECVATAMEVGQFGNDMQEADYEIQSYMESHGIGDNDDQVVELYAEAAFGGDSKKGIIAKIMDFLKKLYNKLADMVRGLISRFKNTGKDIRQKKSAFQALWESSEGKNLPDSARYEAKLTDFKGGMAFLTTVFEYENTYLKANVGGVSFSELNTNADTLGKELSGDLKSFNSGKADGLQKQVQSIQNAVGTENNKTGQNKLMAAVYNDKLVDDIKSLGPIKTDGTEEPTEKINEAIFDTDTRTYTGGEIKKNVLVPIKEGFDTFKIDDVVKALNEGAKKFADKAKALEATGKNLEKSADQAKRKNDDPNNDSESKGAVQTAISTVTGVMNQYATLVSMMTVVITKSYNLGSSVSTKLFAEVGSVTSSIQSLYDKEGTS
ncbi:MAG: hypothetical protein ACOCRO_03860 [Halanaerobiales bacterium]